MTANGSSPVAHLSWRRIGALSASFNLHGIAVALALLAILAPVSAPENRTIGNVLIADIVEPPPIQPPAVSPARVQMPVRPRADPAPQTPLAVERPVRATPVPVPSAFAEPADDASPTPIVVQAAEPPLTRGAAAYASVDAPAYPPLARRHRLEGETVLRVLVGTDGLPRQVDIGRSSGHRELDRPAMTAVRGWRFRAAMEGGIPIESWVEVPIVFRLQRG